jgi:hypothetical protein
MRRLSSFLLVLVLLTLVLPARGAGRFSKNYEFKTDVRLEIGVATGDGLRLDWVQFKVPAVAEGRDYRTGGLVMMEAGLSNTAGESLSGGIAVALFDGEGNLVGAASGGSRLTSIRSGRQKSYRVVFEDVNAHAYKARTFQITIESK